jgi:hypothetical protein
VPTAAPYAAGLVAFLDAALRVPGHVAFIPCACRKLDPAVLMMKAAEDRLSSELAEPSNRPMARRILVQ